MNRPESKKERLNLLISSEIREEMDRLKEELEADSLGEVVRRAIIAYGKLVELQNEGVIIKAKYEGQIVRIMSLD